MSRQRCATKEERKRSSSRWGRLGHPGLALLMSVPVASGEECTLPEDTAARSLLQAKNAMKTLAFVREDMRPETSLLAHDSVDSIRGDVVNIWPLLVLSVLFLLCTWVLVNHEAVLKRFEKSERTSLEKVPQEAEGDFCPDLVVPAGCECVLIVPSRPKRGEPFDITDNNGATVLTVADDEASASSAFPRRALLAGGVVLAKCGRAESSIPSSMLTAIDFELVTSKGDVWADLRYEPREGSEEQDRCSIKSKTGRQLMVSGSVRHNALNLTDHHGGLLATTEPISTTGPQGHAPGTIFRLRIAPQADVGLVLCALICLQHLST